MARLYFRFTSLFLLDTVLYWYYKPPYVLPSAIGYNQDLTNNIKAFLQTLRSQAKYTIANAQCIHLEPLYFFLHHPLRVIERRENIQLSCCHTDLCDSLFACKTLMVRGLQGTTFQTNNPKTSKFSITTLRQEVNCQSICTNSFWHVVFIHTFSQSVNISASNLVEKIPRTFQLR